jgi:hypothetical protein
VILCSTRTVKGSEILIPLGPTQCKSRLVCQSSHGIRKKAHLIIDVTKVLPRDRGSSLPKASLTDSRINTDPLKSILTELLMKVFTTSDTSSASSYIRGSWPIPTSSPRLVFCVVSIAQEAVEAKRALRFCHSLLSSCTCQRKSD